MNQSLSFKKKCAIVFGVGAQKGIGAAICRRVAREDIKVYVVGRTKSKLDLVVREINSKGGRAEAYVVDTTDEKQVNNFFKIVEDENLILDLVVHNVGGNYPSRFLHTSLDFFDSMWKSVYLSGFHVGQYATQMMQRQKQGTVLFTGASASLRGKPFFAAFTLGKAAIRNYVQGLSTLLKESNIHVGHIIIDGVVDGDRVNHAVWGLGGLFRRFKPSGGLNIDAIAESYWQIYQEPKAIWTQEIDLRPYKEKF